MINLLVDEAYAFDYLSILDVKRKKKSENYDTGINIYFPLTLDLFENGKIQIENFKSDLNDVDKIYFTPDVLDRLSNITNVVKVQIVNLNDILNSEFSNNEIIDIIKIDAEGKDFNIVKSIESNLHRIKFIAIECTSHKDNLTRFEEEGTKKEFVEYFKEKKFDIHYCIDHEYRSDNRTQMSDITFVNLNI